MSKAIGLDCGTVFFQTAESIGDKINIKTVRNVFVEVKSSDDIDEDVLKDNRWQYVRDGDKFYVIGPDAFNISKIFPQVELRRPMQDGVLNKNEDKKMLILAELIESSIGKAKDRKSVVCACISSPSVDGSQDSTFHKARLQGIIQRLGYNSKIIEEGYAVILSERPVMIEADGTESPYSGIGLSWGGGRVNCVLAYKGLQIIGFSAARCGDFIDNKVSEQTDTPIAQVTSKKEKELDFTNLNYNDDVIFALNAYYESMIEYVFEHFSKKFMEVKSDFSDIPLDIILAGGSANPKGFCDKIKEVISRIDLPFKVKDVKLAGDIRNAVVKGCLIAATSAQKKLEKSGNVMELIGE